MAEAQRTDRRTELQRGIRASFVGSLKKSPDPTIRSFSNLIIARDSACCSAEAE
jgi:hypothetical protein